MKSENQLNNITLMNELSSHYDSVEEMSAIAFGPGRFSRSAFRLREGVPHENKLSFVAHDDDGKMVGSVKLTKILIGDETAILLGPLVVTECYKNKGLGAVLMKASIDAAREAGHEVILLVGDLPYYQRFGFQSVPYSKITMPAPVERDRLLICELQDGVADKFQGEAGRFV